MRIGDVIASIRRRKRIEQKHFAELVDIGVTYLSDIENGRKTPSIRLVRVIAAKLDVPIDVILFMVLEEKYFASDEGREVFKAAKPVMEDVINLLIDLSQDVTSTKSRKKNSSNKRKQGSKTKVS